MATAYQALKINGVISTDKTALQNLNELCTAAGAFLTYDVSQGKWAVIINSTGTSIKSFDDSNIIGSINVSETGVSELYNSVSLEFPHKTLRDQTDFVEVTIPEEDRFPNEVDNTLNIQSTVINDPVQAQYLASIELKQSRLNKIISFTTDYTSLGLKAGDLIDVTSEMYGYTNKIFRITRLEEIDEDIIGVNITALEYDPAVYDQAGIVVVEKTKKTGIMLKQQNQTIRELEDASVAGSLGRMIAANVGLGIANNLLNKLFGRKQIGTDANGNPIYSNKTKPTDTAAEDVDKVLANSNRPALSTSSVSKTSVCAGDSFVFTVGHSCSSCLFTIPDFDYDYEITGVALDELVTPNVGTITVSNGTGTLTVETASDALDGTITITCGGQTKSVTLRAAKDYTYAVTKDNASITEGGTVVFTLTTTGSKLDATIPYAITGSATGKITSPALTGTVTASGGTATLTVVTTDDSSYTGSQSIVVTFEPSLNDPCGTVTGGDGSNSATVTVLDNDVASTTCARVTVPVVWCGTYNGADEQLTSLTAVKTASFAVAQAGEPTVQLPLTVSVTKGNPSSVTVTSYATVAQPIASQGGIDFKVITTFNTVVPKGAITGTTTTVTGY